MSLLPTVEQDHPCGRQLLHCACIVLRAVILQPWLLLSSPQPASFVQIDPSWNGFAYVCDGSGTIGGTKGKREQAMVLGSGDHVTASTTDASFRFLLVAGKPIGEPIVQHGPFVMNTQGRLSSLSSFIVMQCGGIAVQTQTSCLIECCGAADEIHQAFMDYQSGKLQNPDDNVWEA